PLSRSSRAPAPAGPPRPPPRPAPPRAQRVPVQAPRRLWRPVRRLVTTNRPAAGPPQGAAGPAVTRAGGPSLVVTIPATSKPASTPVRASSRQNVLLPLSLGPVTTTMAGETIRPPAGSERR